MRTPHSDSCLLRRPIARLALALFLLPTLSCDIIFGGDEVAPSDFSRRTTESGLRYTLAIPANLPLEEPVPLVLALHFRGEVTPFFGSQALVGFFEPGLRELEALIVAPDLTGERWTDEVAEEDVLAILEEVRADFNTDARRTLITGYSLGGIGTWHFAARHPDRFAAGVVVSGYPPEGVLDGGWSVPLYVIHGSRDELLPLGATEEAVQELERRGVIVELVVVDGPTHFMVGEFLDSLKDAVPWIREVWGS